MQEWLQEDVTNNESIPESAEDFSRSGLGLFTGMGIHLASSCGMGAKISAFPWI